MGGGKRRPSKTPNRRDGATAACRHSVPSPSQLSARKKTEPPGPNRRGTAIRYSYDDDPSGPIVLSSSSTVAFVDRAPCSEPSFPIPSYNYDPAVVGGLGLGFRGEENEEDEVEVEEVDKSEGFDAILDQETENEEKGGGFLSIGGIRVYTEDTSSPDDDASDDGDSIGSEDSSCEEEEGEERDYLDGSSSSSSSDDDDDDDSEIDDELVEDYIEGIGGSGELLSADWLANNLEEEILSDQGVGKLGGIDLMNASVQYGMKRKLKPRKGKGNGRSSKVGSPVVEIGLSAAMDDLMFVKDPRTASGRRKKKMALSHLSRSWPSKEYYGARGGKKKQRKELIAVKRRERMMNRGVDLDQINLKLRHMVIDEVDMFSFQPMHPRDCSQVQRLASIYRLRSGCQGSGKKRFVTVTRTGQTCLPSSRDKLRLDKLLGTDVSEDFSVVDHGKKIKFHTQTKDRTKTGRKQTLYQSAPPKLTKNAEASGGKKRAQSSASFAERPVSFVSSGIMEVNSAMETMALDPNECVKTERSLGTSSSSKVGAFEMHTKGFGSKMMAKMGFVEGSGLGKDGQGMVQPIEAIQRPKSLGLGVQFDEVAQDARVGSGSASSSKVGAFEMHTKGFGSKMMAKMGFVEGSGLGKDRQGIVQPVEAIQRPKSLGLGVQFDEVAKDARVGSGNIGGFERHTKGFGSRMMARMGFIPGTGLGKDAQGIVNPLTAVRRPKARGLGATK